MGGRGGRHRAGNRRDRPAPAPASNVPPPRTTPGHGNDATAILWWQDGARPTPAQEWRANGGRW